MTNLVPSAPTSLPPRLDGFLDAFAVISYGQYPQGGLQIDFPASVDRANLEQAGSNRGESLGVVDVQGVATFLGLALGYTADFCETLRQILASELLETIQREFSTTELEIWCHDGGGDATLSVCMNPGEREQWLELSWFAD